MPQNRVPPCWARTVRIRFWHIASFRRDAEFGRYRGIADMAGLAGGPTPARMTPNGHCDLANV